jgi:hypothetical protein
MGYKKCLLVISWYCDRERFEAFLWEGEKSQNRITYQE